MLFKAYVFDKTDNRKGVVEIIAGRKDNKVKGRVGYHVPTDISQQPVMFLDGVVRPLSWFEGIYQQSKGLVSQHYDKYAERVYI